MSDLISRQVVIDTEGLDEQIRCEMCRNPMHTYRGCDGNCKYDEKLYERIMQIISERIKPLSSVQLEPSQVARDIATIIENEKDMRVVLSQPELKMDGDAISRAEAIRIASGYCHPANVAKELAKLPSVQPTYTAGQIQKMQEMEQAQIEKVFELGMEQPELHYDEWCTDCKEYDQERHCCPRWNRVIRETLRDAQEIIYCRDCKHRGEKPIADGRYWCEIHNTFMYYCSDAERRTDG